MTVSATLLGTLLHGLAASRPAANAVAGGTVYSATDTGAISQSDGSSWSTWATISAGIADQGAFTFLDGTVAAAPATPAAGKLRVYAKTGKVLAVKDDAGVETVFGSGSALHACRVNRSTTLAIATATETAITMPNEDKDTDAFHAASDAFITIPTGLGGYYAITGWAEFASSTAGTFRYLRLYVNATNLIEIQIPFQTNVGDGGVVSTQFQLAQTDTVQLKVYQDSGGNLNITGASLSLALIGV